MADAISIESVVDDLSKPENQAELNKTLNDAFKEATTTPAEDKTAAPNPGDNKDVTKTEDKDPSKQNAGEGDKKPANRVEELLADRNAAKTEAAAQQTENQALQKQIADLTKLVEELSSGKKSERTGDDAGADDKPMTKKEIDEYLAKKEAEKNQSTEQAQAAEKSIADQIQALDNDKSTPNAKDYADNLKALMAKHPTISAYAAYRMLQGEGIIPMDGVKVSNANRTGTGNRSKTNLLDTKKPEEMSQNELLAHLTQEQKSGNLKI